jgi:hypothetical protein
MGSGRETAPRLRIFIVSDDRFHLKILATQLEWAALTFFA